MKRERMALAERQVSGLIDLVLAGEDADRVIGDTFEEIHEGSGGGPYPLGSKVKINTTWSGKTIEGTDVTVSRGDVVSVVQHSLGEHGVDRMVLLSDGKTRVVVPYAILGESNLGEQGNGNGNGNGNLNKGPDGHEIDPAKGKVGGLVQGKAQGDAPTPEQSQPPTPTASKQPTASVPSTFQGAAKPKDAPTAQTPGMMAPSSISGKTVEQIESEVLQALDSYMEQAGNNDKMYRQASELQRTLVSEADPIMYAVLHTAIFGEASYTVAALQEVASLMIEKKRGISEQGNGNGNGNGNGGEKKNGNGNGNGGKKKKNGNGDDDEEDEDDDDMEESYTEQDIDEIFQAMGRLKK